MYQLIDRRSGQVVGTYATLRLACRVADRRDAGYGEPCTTIEQVA